MPANDEDALSPSRRSHGSLPPLRVGYVLPWPVVGGGELATLRLAQAFNEEADEAAEPAVVPIAYCAERHAGAVSDLYRRSAIATRTYAPIEFSYRHAAAFLRDSLALASRFRAERIDVVHGSDLAAVYQAGLAARLAGVPFVCHIRSQFPDRWSRRRKLPIGFVSQFVFVSHATWSHFNSIRSVAPERGQVVYDWPAVDLSADPPGSVDVVAIRRQLGVPAGRTLITMVARVAPQKDFATLFAAFERLRAHHHDIHLLLVGDAEASAAGQAFAAECRARAGGPLAGHVTWAGFQANVTAVLDASDIVTLVSHGEGVPLVLLEAMARARPVVATEVGGIPELVEAGVSGLLHRPHDASDLDAQWRRLLSDRAFATGLAARGQQRVRAGFTRAAAIGCLRTLYRRVAGRVTSLPDAVAVAAS